MTSKSVFFCILLLLVLLSNQAEGNNFNLAMASKALSDKGYQAMSMIFDIFFKTHDVSEWLSGNSTLTVFSPPDHAFFSFKYPQPPLTLLQYHVVPLKLDSEDLGSLPHGSKIDTLLLGHPLVVTTLPVDGYASFNGVRVSEWNLYIDGGLIIHGVDDYFDPAFQTLIWFDMKKDIHAEVVSGLTLAVKELTENLFLLLTLVVIGHLVLSFCPFKDDSDEDEEYERLKQQEEEEVKEVVDHVLDVKAVYVKQFQPYLNKYV